jgi:hypothetical protein
MQDKVSVCFEEYLLVFHRKGVNHVTQGGGGIEDVDLAGVYLFILKIGF